MAKKNDISANLSEEDRRKLIERAKESLPALDEKLEKAILDLERISSGQRRS